MVVFLLCSDDLEVEQVTLQLPVARGRVPSGWRDNLEASELGRLLPGGRVKNIERKVGRRSPGQDEVWRCAVHRLWPCSLFLHHVPSTHSVQEAQAGTVHAIVGVAGIDGLKKISYMTVTSYKKPIFKFFILPKNEGLYICALCVLINGVCQSLISKN